MAQKKPKGEVHEVINALEHLSTQNGSRAGAFLACAHDGGLLYPANLIIGLHLAWLLLGIAHYRLPNVLGADVIQSKREVFQVSSDKCVVWQCSSRKR
jgi:hypothetical protein